MVACVLPSPPGELDDELLRSDKKLRESSDDNEHSRDIGSKFTDLQLNADSESHDR